MFSILLVVASIQQVTANAVVPDGNISDVNNTDTLNYKFFSQLRLEQEIYYLEDNFTLSNIHNVLLTGHGASIICKPHVGLTFINITNITLEHMTFIRCAKDWGDHFALNYSHYMSDAIFANKAYSQQASIVFYNCSFAAVRNVSIRCNTGVHALMVENVMVSVHFSNVMVCLEKANNSVISSGIFFHIHVNKSTNAATIISLENFKFNLLEGNHSRYKFSFIAVKILLLESNSIVNVSVVNMTFSDFYNSMLLYYHAKFHKLYSRNIFLDGIEAYRNKADLPIPLLYMAFHGFGFDFKSFWECKQKNKVYLHNGIFKSNMNLIPIIYVKMKNTLVTSVNITIYSCIVRDNINTSFVQTNSEIVSLLQLTHTIKIKHVNITNNTNHITGVSLLSFSHGLAKLRGPITIKGNYYYETIITLYFTTLQFRDRINISENIAYILINTLENSYFVLQENVSIEVINNTLHSGIRKTDWIDNLGFIGFNDNAKICLVQFHSQRGNLDAEFIQNKSSINYKMVLSNNRFSQPLHLAMYDLGIEQQLFMAR